MPADTTPRRPITWRTVGVLLIPAVLLFALPALLFVGAAARFRAFSVPTGAMTPAILPGDRIFADMAAYGSHHEGGSATAVPRRGDIIVFLYPEDRRRYFVERVIGLPGETIEIRDRAVYVDGRRLDEPYASFLDDDTVPERLGWGPLEVPGDSLFVLGDNRDNSRDSRYWGFLPLTDVRGRARVVYFSWDAAEGRVRWERLGLALR
jgi:signal peptidase I